MNDFDNHRATIKKAISQHESYALEGNPIKLGTTWKCDTLVPRKYGLSIFHLTIPYRVPDI
jgi:hypothetical protein